MKIKAEIIELTLTQSQNDAVPVSIEKVYRQPSEQRKIRLLESRKVKRMLEEHPRAGINIELEWIADFPQKIDMGVLDRWLEYLRSLAGTTHHNLIRKG
jgi:hypothetical protein